MSKKLQMHIAEPCHENWDNMSPVEKGRFCDSCRKQVVDFSTMSDREIVQFFKKPSTGSVCGRFMNEQLDRDMVIEKKRLPWIKYFFQFVFPVFVISKQAYTQGMLIRRTPPIDIPALSTKEQLKKNPLLSELKIIVTDAATGLPVPYASVNINRGASEINLGGSTKADGAATFKVGKENSLDIEITSVGYKTEIITLAPTDLLKNEAVRIALKVDVKEMKEVTVTSFGITKVRTIMGASIKITRDTIWHTVDQGLPSLPKSVSSKIFPNPLPQTQTASIEINAKENGWIYAMIVDANGKLIAMEKWNAVKGVNRFTIDVTARMIAGVYFIRLTNEKGKLIRTDQLIIQ